MSKKKATTMTLKDFHGGSIPSQFSLPSAPASFATGRLPDRPGAWGPAAASSGRPDHQLHLLRPRPGSAGAASASASSARGLDEQPPAFLSHPPHIGRHFDEDERKPFDASSAPRRPLAPSETTPRSPPPLAPARSEPKRPVSSPLVHSPAVVAHAPVFAVPHPSSNAASAPNAWGLRKEIGSEPPPPQPTQMWSASRLAQASAVEKVSSGLWQSKTPDVEGIRSHGSTEVLDRRFGESLQIADDIDRDRYRERPRSVSSSVVVSYAEAKERTLMGYCTDRAQDQERARSPVRPEVKERDAVGFSNEGVRAVSSEGRFGSPKLYQQQGAVDISERPKLKLLPRTKPFESPDTQTRDFDDNNVYQAPVSFVQVQNVHEMHGSTNPPKKSGSPGVDEGSRTVERPKLNLKPRTQPIERSAGNADRERHTVFGGARPRELVLKERGIDVATNDNDIISPSNRARNDIPSTDLKIEPTPTTQPGEKAERLLVGQRTGKDLERKGYQLDLEKGDLQRTSWRNDNQRNTRENEKPLEQTRADTDTWRKPVEQPKPDIPAPRFGKTSSALELAQAFSSSVSDARVENHFTSQRSIPGQSQLPFSRLTDTTRSGPAQRQINGY